MIVSSPFPIDSQQGNSVSARRIVARIGDLGITAIAHHGTPPPDTNLLIALHARRSLSAMRSFKQRFPERPLVVVVTGSDLYHDLPAGDTDVLEGLRLADALVTYQEQTAKDLPEEFHAKTHVIWKSVALPAPGDNHSPPPAPPDSPITFSILAHLREIKDPFLPAAALEKLGNQTAIQLDHYGNALKPGMADQAREWEKREPRYRWRGSLGRDQVAMTIMRSHATINSGRAEGGSNAICESVVLGVPVLASHTPANIGILGEDYGGYFPAGEAAGLAELMRQSCLPDSPLLAKLRGQVDRRAPLFHADSESAGWKKLLIDLGLLKDGF